MLKQAGCISTGGAIETDQAARIVTRIREPHVKELYKWPQIISVALDLGNTWDSAVLTWADAMLGRACRASGPRMVAVA